MLLKLFKHFIILIVSTYYILCISWIVKRLSLTHGANMKFFKNMFVKRRLVSVPSLGNHQAIIQGDSKRWTKLKSKRRLNTGQTAVCGFPSSLLALQIDLCGQRSKLFFIRLTFSSDTHGRPEILPLHRQPIC